MKFEPISACPDAYLPTRATKYSAGYDFFAYADITIPAHSIQLVSTGVKCWMNNDTALLLMVRSSMPRKMGLMLANAPGLVDADYAQKKPGTAPLYTDEGHILFQLWNYTNDDVIIHRGDRIGQGVFVKYGLTDDDYVENIRTGGLGSTSALLDAIFNPSSSEELQHMAELFNGAAE